MRQGQVAPQGKWTGNQQGGVKAPEALILPDPSTRFARTAARLNALSAGHPMAEWLCFMARLAEAQHAAAGTMAAIAGPTQAAVEQAVAARLPVLLTIPLMGFILPSLIIIGAPLAFRIIDTLGSVMGAKF